jgi:hypothetical protein
MTTVYWDVIKPGFDNEDCSLDLAIMDLEPVLPSIIKSRNHAKDASYLNCPAFLEYYKNTFVVRSPINIKLNVDYATKHLTIYPQGQEFYDKFIVNRAAVLGDNDPFLVSILVHYCFASDEECMLEQMPVTFNFAEIPNIRPIPGIFDISKWYRPIELGFEVIDSSKPVEIKRGDPVVYVRFTPKDGSKVTLKRKEFSKEQLTNVNRCTSLKNSLPKQPLKVLYKLAEVLNMNFPKKCPFDWRK